jgi:predicted nucleotidyltransferase
MKIEILDQIKNSVLANEPNAELFLFGSYARGDNRNDSDIDILVLLNKDTISREDEKRIIYSLYDIELESGKIISPMIYSKKTWETKYTVTPFYKSIAREGKRL